MEEKTTLAFTVLQGTRTGLAVAAAGCNNKNNNSEYWIYCTNDSVDIKVANIWNLHHVLEENCY
jgi:hypothetical protein